MQKPYEAEQLGRVLRGECAVTVEVRDDHGQRITEVTMTVTDETVTIKVARAVASRALDA